VLDVQNLADVDLFRTLPDDALVRLVGSATERTLRRGDVVFDEGDDAAELFVVERGRATCSATWRCSTGAAARPRPARSRPA
jgi:hypothetical protein